MKTKYPIVFVHGIILGKKAFGKLDKYLNSLGYSAYKIKSDAFTVQEKNAPRIKEGILRVLEKEHVDKVNIIAHSKGGTDAIYMINELDMADHVASVTTLCTPHRGSILAEFMLNLPKFFLKPLTWIVNHVYKMLGDKNPDFIGSFEELKPSEANANGSPSIPDYIYAQSYSIVLDKSRHDFVMSIPLAVSHHLGDKYSDGMVTIESAQWGNYRGNAIEGSISHSTLIDFGALRKNRKKVREFYVKMIDELAEMGC